MKAWLFQDPRQKKKHGKKAPWCVGWIDPEGRRKSKRVGLKTAAEKYRRRVEGELAAGIYETHKGMSWEKFRAEFDQKIANGMKPQTREATLVAINVFERIIKPKRVDAIKTSTIDDFIAQRRTERGLRKGSTVSFATVNKELRHLKAVLRLANEWEYLSKVPRIRMLNEPQRIKPYVTPDDFASIYAACEKATMPKSLCISPSEWWEAFVTFAYMTGWRRSEILALRREDIDLQGRFAFTRHDDNKGGRDETIKLHPVVLDHLKGIASFEPVIFPWYHNIRSLYSEFHRIQKAAGIHLPCRDNHEHTDACHFYGFHAFRRAFATANAGALSGDVLQKLMRHKSYTTTQRYINMASRVDEAVAVLSVPSVLTKQA